MTEFIKGIFMNGGTTPSSMRVMSFEIVQVALLIALIEVIRGTLTLDSIGLILGLITVALTGKVMQKGKEGNSVEVTRTNGGS